MSFFNYFSMSFDVSFSNSKESSVNSVSTRISQFFKSFLILCCLWKFYYVCYISIIFFLLNNSSFKIKESLLAAALNSFGETFLSPIILYIDSLSQIYLIRSLLYALIYYGDLPCSLCFLREKMSSNSSFEYIL